MSSTFSLRRSASRMFIVAGVLSIGVGLLTFLFPPVLDKEVWGHPFDPTTAVVVAISLVFLHLMKAYGFLGLSRLEGGGAIVRWSMLIAALGLVIVATCEGVSATLVGVPITSPAAVNLDNGYGVGSMMLAIPSIIGGAVIVRKNLLEGFGRWSVLLSGAFMVLVVTPALMMGRGPAAYLALTGWSVFYIWIGWTYGRTSPSENA